MSKTKLTIKQEKFVNKYIESGNASEAYRFAYYCLKMSDNAKYVQANKMLNSPKIALRIEELQKPLREKSQITKEKVLSELAAIGFASLADIKAKDKIAALVSISRMLGFDAPQKVAHTDAEGNDVCKPLTAEEKRQILKDAGLCK